jgi:hypothetical protein
VSKDILGTLFVAVGPEVVNVYTFLVIGMPAVTSKVFVPVRTTPPVVLSVLSLTRFQFKENFV